MCRRKELVEDNNAQLMYKPEKKDFSKDDAKEKGALKGTPLLFPASSSTGIDSFNMVSVNYIFPFCTKGSTSLIVFSNLLLPSDTY